MSILKRLTRRARKSRSSTVWGARLLTFVSMLAMRWRFGKAFACTRAARLILLVKYSRKIPKLRRDLIKPTQLTLMIVSSSLPFLHHHPLVSFTPRSPPSPMAPLLLPSSSKHLTSHHYWIHCPPRAKLLWTVVVRSNYKIFVSRTRRARAQRCCRISALMFLQARQRPVSVRAALERVQSLDFSRGGTYQLRDSFSWMASTSRRSIQSVSGLRWLLFNRLAQPSRWSCR